MGIKRGKGAGIFRNMDEGHMDDTRTGGIKGGKWEWLGWLGVVAGKWRKLYLSNNKKNVKKQIGRQTKKNTMNQIWVLAPQAASSLVGMKENCSNTRKNEDKRKY